MLEIRVNCIRENNRKHRNQVSNHKLYMKFFKQKKAKLYYDNEQGKEEPSPFLYCY